MLTGSQASDKGEDRMATTFQQSRRQCQRDHQHCSHVGRASQGQRKGPCPLFSPLSDLFCTPFRACHDLLRRNLLHSHDSGEKQGLPSISFTAPSSRMNLGAHSASYPTGEGPPMCHEAGTRA